MDVTRLKAQLIAWLKEQRKQAGADGFVVGLSGGLDSAVVAALCRQAVPENVLGVIMPCRSDPDDAAAAVRTAAALDIAHETVDLSDHWNQLVSQLKAVAGDGNDEEADVRLAAANVKARLQMITLYYIASRRNALVAGTGNRSELTIGYFTKHGDGGVDLLPIGGLVKTQVRALAEVLKVPREVIERTPSAGLWAGQTDEDEMGFSYEVLDRYILTGEGPSWVKERVEGMAARSAHKRARAPIGPTP